MNRFVAYNMPKIELHCHLDGSMSVDVIRELLAKKGENFEEKELLTMLQAPVDCESLAEYLKCFDTPISCIQTKEGLRIAAEDLALTAAKEQVKYLEVRFAPSFSTAEGCDRECTGRPVQRGAKGGYLHRHYCVRYASSGYGNESSHVEGCKRALWIWGRGMRYGRG